MFHRVRGGNLRQTKSKSYRSSKNGEEAEEEEEQGSNTEEEEEEGSKKRLLLPAIMLAPPKCKTCAAFCPISLSLSVSLSHISEFVSVSQCR